MDKTIINVESGEITYEEFIAEELKEREIVAKALQKEAAEAEAKALEAKTKRIALLDKLGITEEEAKLLLG